MAYRILLAALILAGMPPAKAADFVAQTRDGAHVELLTIPGVCTGSALSAAWVSPDATERVAGCWKVAGRTVVMVFLDGDSLELPAGAFKALQRF